MPTIRDARGQLTVDDNPPRPPAGSGPVERLLASPERMADIAAERQAQDREAAARMARIADERRARAEARKAPPGTFALPPGPVAESRRRGHENARKARAARTEETPMAPPPQMTKREANRLERVGRYVQAVRETPTYREAAELLGVSKHAVEMFMSDLRRRGEMPEDLDHQLKVRARGSHRRITAATLPPLIELVAQDPAPATIAPRSGAPCRVCIHAPVCSLKPGLEAVLEGLKPTSPNPAITIAVAVDVTCQHYQAAAR